MLIVCQDKEEIINFDNILNICILLDEDNNIWKIYAGLKAPDDNYRILGYFKTKERAKEILESIGCTYKATEAFKVISNRITDQVGAEVIKEGFVYEVPER